MGKFALVLLLAIGCSSTTDGVTFGPSGAGSSAGGSKPLEQSGSNSGGTEAGGSKALEGGSGGSTTSISGSSNGGSSGASTMPVAGSGGSATPSAGTNSGGSSAGQPSAGTGGTTESEPQGGAGGEPEAGGMGGAGGATEPEPEPVCESTLSYLRCTGNEDEGTTCSAEEFASICGVGLDPQPWLHIAHPWDAQHHYCVGDQVVSRNYGATGTGACQTSPFICTDEKLCNQYAPDTEANTKSIKGLGTMSGTWRQMRKGGPYTGVACTKASVGACQLGSN